MLKKVVVVADGIFPVHEIPLGFLREADVIVCCDGSAENVHNAGFVPQAIVGDMDSISKILSDTYYDRIYIERAQDTNDLTKAVTWCYESGYTDIVIVGATGKREDHTLGNISLLAEYVKYLKVKMVTDSGIFYPLLESCTINSFEGQQVSIFSIDPQTEITSSGLRYPLTRRKLGNWWEATLNEAIGDYFYLSFSGGPILVFMKFRD
jgi:thiamine pyrophosphokinase